MYVCVWFVNRLFVAAAAGRPNPLLCSSPRLPVDNIAFLSFLFFLLLLLLIRVASASAMRNRNCICISSFRASSH